MIFSKEEALLILDLNRISLVTEKEGQVLEIPDYVVKDKTIIDEERFHFLVRDFLRKFLKNGTAVYIVLAESLTIKEEIRARNSDELSIQLENILKTLPYGVSDTEKIITPIAKEIFRVIFSETKIYKNIVAICRESMLNPKGVYPWVSLGYTLEQKIEPQAMRFVIKNLKGENRNTDFTLSDRKEVVFSSSKSRISLIILGVVVFLAISGGVFAFIKRPASERIEEQPSTLAVTEKVASPSSIPSEASSASEKKDYANKEDLRFLIENGTGVAGQGANVKTDLEGDGFTSIDAKNYENYDQVKTQVLFSKSVSPEDQEAIVALLKKRFAEVEVSKELPADNFEIEIITGGEEL